MLCPAVKIAGHLCKHFKFSWGGCCLVNMLFFQVLSYPMNMITHVSLSLACSAYQNNDINEFEKILKINSVNIMQDPFIREHIEGRYCHDMMLMLVLHKGCS